MATGSGKDGAIRVGIVGVGIRGRMYAGICRDLPGAELAGVCDISEPARSGATQRLGVAAFDSADRMCREVSPDAVVVATPDFAHVAPAVAAAQAGCHLLIEKPLAMSLDDAGAICRAVDQAGVSAMVAFENHWNPPLVAMKAAADAGELGRIVSGVSQLDDRIDVPTRFVPWLGQSSPGWFLLAHTVDLTGWIADQKPSRVQASGVRGVLSGLGLDTYDAIHAVIDFDGGMVGAFSSCWVLPESLPLAFQFRHEVVGTGGSMRVDLTDQMLHKATRAGDDGPGRYEHPSTIGVTMGGAVASPPGQMFAEFISSLAGGRELPCGLDEGLLNVAAIEAVHTSIETGSPVEVQR